MTPLLSTNSRQLPPLTLTYEQLHAILYPLVMDYKWGRDTIHDLWKIGAPLPDGSGKRIIFPRKLGEWLTDVLTRQGRPLSDDAKIYMQLLGG